MTLLHSGWKRTLHAEFRAHARPDMPGHPPFTATSLGTWQPGNSRNSRNFRSSFANQKLGVHPLSETVKIATGRDRPLIKAPAEGNTYIINTIVNVKCYFYLLKPPLLPLFREPVPCLLSFCAPSCAETASRRTSVRNGGHPGVLMRKFV